MPIPSNKPFDQLWAETCREAQIVHVLDAGNPLCRFTTGFPNEWPAGNVWVGVHEWQLATCEKCRTEGQERSRQLHEKQNRTFLT